MEPAAEAVEEAEEIIEEAAPAEEVEELDELEDLEEVEAETSSTPLAAPEVDINHLASQIEFSSAPEPENTPDESIQEEELEVVSPFSTMLSDFSDLDDDDDILFSGDDEELAPNEIVQPKKTEAPKKTRAPKKEAVPKKETAPKSKKAAKEISKAPSTDADDKALSTRKGQKKNETLNETQNEVPKAATSVNQGFSLIAKPFFAVSSAKIETLQALPADDSEGRITAEDTGNPDDSGIIREHEGVHYISGDALKPGSEADADLNHDFKKLVDSIIK